jgi:hypothetical protein
VGQGIEKEKHKEGRGRGRIGGGEEKTEEV